MPRHACPPPHPEPCAPFPAGERAARAGSLATLAAVETAGDRLPALPQASRLVRAWRARGSWRSAIRSTGASRCRALAIARHGCRWWGWPLRPRREPHRARVHRGLERKLALRGAPSLRVRQPARTRSAAAIRCGSRGCYVTAAARCAPPANKPTRAELERCRPFPAAETRLLCARARGGAARAHRLGSVAAGFGLVGEAPGARATALRARAEGRLPDGTLVLCSFHPSRQNTNTGRLTRGDVARHLPAPRAVVDEEST